MNDENHSEREVVRLLLSHEHINQQGVIDAFPLLLEHSSGKDMFEYLFNVDRGPIHLDGFGSAFIIQAFLSVNPVAGRTFMEMMEFFYLGNRQEMKDRYDVMYTRPMASIAVGVLLGVLRVADNINTPANNCKVDHEEYEKLCDQVPALLAAFVNGNVPDHNIAYRDRGNMFNEELELLLKRGAATYLADERRQTWMREFCRQTKGIVATNFKGTGSSSQRVYTNLFFGFAGSVSNAQKHRMLKVAIG